MQLGTWMNRSYVEVKRSSSQQGQISTLVGIFSPSYRMRGHVFMKLVIMTHYQIHMTLMTFSRSWIQRSRSQTTFPKNALFCRRHFNQRFASEEHLVFNVRSSVNSKRHLWLMAFKRCHDTEGLVPCLLLAIQLCYYFNLIAAECCASTTFHACCLCWLMNVACS